MNFPLLSFLVAVPAVAAAVLLCLPATAREWIRAVSVLGAAVSCAASFVAAWCVVVGIDLAESAPIVPALGIAWSLDADGWSACLLVLTGVITVAGAFASFSVEDRPREFYVFLLLLVAGVFGVFVAQDLFLFFLFYEIAVLPMYLLIGIWGSSNTVAPAGPFAGVFRRLSVGGREYAAMKLTLMLLVGSALILAAIFGMAQEAGGTFAMGTLQATSFSPALQHWAFPALWVGFGTLAGLFPFHTWSPDGHASAPTAVSMLHAGVLMKLGAFGVMRIGMVLLPEGAQEWAVWVGSVAALNVVWGAVCALAQRDLKYIIAYSSVSHMGVVLLGAATMTVSGWNGAVYQMVAHGMMTGLFFALVGLIYERTHDRWVPHMGGFAKAMPLTAAFFTLAGLSSLGLPGTAGFVAEFLVFLGAFQGPHPWWGVAGAAGAVVTAVYVLRATRMMFWGQAGDTEAHRRASSHLEDARLYERVALWTLGVGLVVLGVWPRFMLDLIDASTMTHLAAVVGGAR